MEAICLTEAYIKLVMTMPAMAPRAPMSRKMSGPIMLSTVVVES